MNEARLKQMTTEIDFTTELQKHGYRTVPDGSAVIVISGDGRTSRARRYESAQVAYNTLIHYPAMEAKQKGE